MPISFLDKSHETKVATATFTPTGLIGALHGMMTFSFYATATPEIVMAYPQKPVFWRTQGDNGFRYYYEAQTDADTVAKQLGDKVIVNQIFCMRMPLASVLNVTDDAKQKFKSDPIIWDVDVSTLRSKNNRHKFQFMFLPAIVSAYATVQGIKHTPFALPDDLINPDAALNEQVELKMIGTPDDYTKGELWQQRKTIWGEMGEPDPTKYNPIAVNPKTGQPDEANATKNDTTSSVLSDLLGIVAWRWTASIWATVITANDPKMPKAGKERYGVPLVVRIFESEEQARAVANEELAAKENNAAPAAPTTTPAVKPVAPAAAPAGKYPAMPVAWDGIEPKDFITEWQKLADKPAALLMKKLELTQAEYDLWKPVIDIEPPF